MPERLVVVGGVAAGMSAAAKARRTNPDLEIVVYEKSGFVSYGACGFPYFIKGDIARIEELIARTPAQFARQGIRALTHHEVTHIDVTARTVTVRDRRTGETRVAPWDKLILTTGGVATRPSLPGVTLSGIFTLRTPEDALALDAWLKEHRPHRGVIVGGGYIGLEMAEALMARGVRVTLIEMLPQVLPTVDPDVAAPVAETLTRHGVEVLLTHRVEVFEGKTRVREVVANGHTFPAEVVVLSVGVRPNVTLAQEAGIALGPTGAVAVDAQMRTNVPHVWAAGDVAEVHHLVTGKPAYIPLGTTANKQGRVAGTNAAGGNARFAGVVGTAVVKVFDLHVARTGLSEQQAREEGIDAAAITVQSTTRAHYMPGSRPIQVKLVYERDTHRLLGGQIVGQEGVAKRIDVLAAALHAGWTTYDLAQLDASYAPPFAPVWDPILVAANVASR